MSPERFQRINEMLDKRQIDLTVCLDGIHKNNNLSAVVRTADAVGIADVHAIMPPGEMRVTNNTSSGSQQWVACHRHNDFIQALPTFKAQDMQIIVTNFSDKAVDFRSIDYTKPTVVVMGNERDGVSQEAIAHADQQVIIPMMGMVQSLNVSVATALILYEAQRQRQQAGMYQQRQVDDGYCQKLLFEQGYPIFAKACRRKQLAYPNIDQQGQIQAPDAWWQAMRAISEIETATI
ncbi:tRNA (guanosine(18)-2'-O)-methyltransferase TrmH [Shewanella marina]|uniref:tRNA (guanosine(18)-2'-O)-methyltransferase TrmH n=1 Tax=Shewanella marina TaxID=487319 RepID=UPI00047063C8|nr:tRNA (guanosine(18)-2'-O)-methyltransferase TrmH [Shewanella marina]